MWHAVVSDGGDKDRPLSKMPYYSETLSKKIFHDWWVRRRGRTTTLKAPCRKSRCPDASWLLRILVQMPEANLVENKEAKSLKLECAIGFGGTRTCAYINIVSGTIPSGFLLHPDGKHTVYPMGSNVIIRTHHTSDQEFLQGHSNVITCLAVSNSGRYIASGQVTHMGFQVGFRAQGDLMTGRYYCVGVCDQEIAEENDFAQSLRRRTCLLPQREILGIIRGTGWQFHHCLGPCDWNAYLWNNSFEGFFRNHHVLGLFESIRFAIRDWWSASASYLENGCGTQKTSMHWLSIGAGKAVDQLHLRRCCGRVYVLWHDHWRFAASKPLSASL